MTNGFNLDIWILKVICDLDHLVTKVRCKDLRDSDWDDFRCRRAVDSSSLFTSLDDIFSNWWSISCKASMVHCCYEAHWPTYADLFIILIINLSSFLHINICCFLTSQASSRSTVFVQIQFHKPVLMQRNREIKLKLVNTSFKLTNFPELPPAQQDFTRSEG